MKPLKTYIIEYKIGKKTHEKTHSVQVQAINCDVAKSKVQQMHRDRVYIVSTKWIKPIKEVSPEEAIKILKNAHRKVGNYNCEGKHCNDCIFGYKFLEHTLCIISQLGVFVQKKG